MRRTLEFLKWKSSQWLAKTLKFDPSLSPAPREGLSAYSFHQAAVFTSLHDHFLSLWQGLKVIHCPPEQLAPTPIHDEEAMRGIDGGDVEMG